MPIQSRAVVCGDIEENAWIVQAEGRDDCVVIDPGDECRKIMRATGGRKVAAILLTHGHFDHIMAVGEMAAETGAPVYVSAEDVEMLNDPRKNGLQDLMGMPSMPAAPIEATPFDGSLTVAGLDFDILRTPGHTKGSVCLYLEGEGMLFSGDTLFMAGFGRTDLYGGSAREMRDSLMRLFALPEAVRVYPGHGPQTAIGVERSRYRL